MHGKKGVDVKLKTEGIGFGTLGVPKYIYAYIQVYIHSCIYHRVCELKENLTGNIKKKTSTFS